MRNADLSLSRQGLLTRLSNWSYSDPQTGRETTTQAIALGLGSIFNHSKHQNVGFRKDVRGSCIVYTALRDIDIGEELCICYGPRLWFEDVDNQSEGEDDDPLEDISRIELDEGSASSM